MQNQFLLSCESTVDMPYSYVNGRGIPLIFYTYAVDGIEYVDDIPRIARGKYLYLDQRLKGLK